MPSDPNRVSLPIGADVKDFLKGVAQAIGGLGQMSAEAKKANLAIGRSITKMQTSMKQFTDQMALGFSKIRPNSKQGKAALEELRVKTAQFGEQMTRSLGSAAGKVYQLNQPLKALGTQFDVLGNKVTTTDIKMKKFGNTVQQTATKSNFFLTAIKRIGSAVGVMLVFQLGRVIAEIFKFEAKVEASMTKIEALVGVPRSLVDEWSRSLSGLTKTTKTVDELADAMYYITSAGIRGAQTLETVAQVSYASAAGLGDVTAVAKTVVSAMNAWGRTSLSSAMATSVLLNTVKEGNLRTEELAGSFAKVIPIASSLGIEMHEVGASIALLSRSGMNAATATTGLRRLMLALAAPSKEARQVLDDIGISAERLREEMAGPDGLQGALRMLAIATEGSFEQVEAAIPSIRALGPALTLVKDDAEDFINVFGSLRRTAEEDTFEAFMKGAEDTDRKIKQLQATWSAFKLEVGEGIGGDAFDELLDAAEVAINLLRIKFRGDAAKVGAALSIPSDLGMSALANQLRPLPNVIKDSEERMKAYKDVLQQAVDKGYDLEEVIAKIPEGSTMLLDELAQAVKEFEKETGHFTKSSIAFEETKREADKLQDYMYEMTQRVFDAEEIERARATAAYKKDLLARAEESRRWAKEQLKIQQDLKKKLKKEFLAMAKDYGDALGKGQIVPENIEQQLREGLLKYGDFLDEITIASAENGTLSGDQLAEALNIALGLGIEFPEDDFDKEVDDYEPPPVEIVVTPDEIALATARDQIVTAFAELAEELSKNVQQLQSDVLFAGLTDDLGSLDKVFENAGKNFASAIADGIAGALKTNNLSDTISDWMDNLEIENKELFEGLQIGLGVATAAAGAYSIYEQARAGEMSIGEGALAGASAGAVFGPWGAAIGAVAGAALVAFTSESQDQLWAQYGQGAEFGPGVTETDMGQASADKFWDDLNKVVRQTKASFMDLAVMFEDPKLYTDLAEAFDNLVFMVGGRAGDAGAMLAQILSDEVPMILLRNVRSSFRAAFKRLGFGELFEAGFIQALEMTGEEGVEMLMKIASAAIAMNDALDGLDFESLIGTLENTAWDNFVEFMEDSLAGIDNFMLKMASETDLAELADDAIAIAELIKNAREAELQMLAAIKQAQDGINAGFDSFDRQLRLATAGSWSEQNKVNIWADMLTEAMDSVGDALSPEEIQRYASTAQQELGALFSYFGQDRMKDTLSSLGAGEAWGLQNLAERFGLELDWGPFGDSIGDFFAQLSQAMRGETDDAFEDMYDAVEEWADTLEQAAIDAAEALNTFAADIAGIGMDEEKAQQMLDLENADAAIQMAMHATDMQRNALLDEYIQTPPTVEINIDGTLDPLIALIDARIQTARNAGGP